jgi:hypothetical protein
MPTSGAAKMTPGALGLALTQLDQPWLASEVLAEAEVHL